MKTQPLTTCDTCAVPAPALPVIQRAGRYTCPQCAAREVLENAAAQQLHALIYPAVLDWVRRWEGEGVSDSALSTMLSLEGLYWHPDGARHRGPVDAFDSAAAVVREASGEG